jgi:hypothetical protein
MLKTKQLFLLILLVSLSSCRYLSGNEVSEKTRVRHRIMKQATEKIQNRYGVKLSQISESSQPMFELIGLGFNHRGPLSKEEIRRIVVESTEILINEMNASEEWRPYLEEWGRYPCSNREASIVLFVLRKDGGELYHPDISVSASRKGVVDYRTDDPNDCYRYFEKTVEPYEVALAIVRGEAQQDDSQPNSTAP